MNREFDDGPGLTAGRGLPNTTAERTARAVSLLDQYENEASTEVAKEPVKTLRRKVSRAELERLHQKAEAQFQADRTDVNRKAVQDTFEALMPPPLKRRSKKRPRKIPLRDHYPTDRTRFQQWLWRQVLSFEDSGGETGLDLAELALRSRVPVNKLGYLVEATGTGGDEKFPKYIHDETGKKTSGSTVSHGFRN